VATREELPNVLWTSKTFVDFEVGLNSAVRKLREALDDSADNPRFVETLPRRGYRFVAPVSFTGGGIGVAGCACLARRRAGSDGAANAERHRGPGSRARVDTRAGRVRQSQGSNTHHGRMAYVDAHALAASHSTPVLTTHLWLATLL
jgi:DNA-binding winged helix-turn-helix (wHTH) protein